VNTQDKGFFQNFLQLLVCPYSTFGYQDDSRDGQAVKVEFSTVADPNTFATLYDMGTTWHDPPSDYGKISITAEPEDEATNVKRVMITFNDAQNGGVPVSELDVLGTATPRQVHGTILIVR
jgi:hypothetical protein